MPKKDNMKFDIIICFEIHVELRTKTKLFCDCEVSSGASPNSHICPVCTGQPGSLPVLNRRAMEYCVRAGLALNCNISNHSRFARKNYFYPDLPKGYQISQYELPLCYDGYINILGDDGEPYQTGIKRIHLEEDAGKLVHSGSSFSDSQYSLVDYNRACVPLIEIVSDHTKNPLRSIPEARSYLEKVRQILRYAEVSECIIEKGQFRCDVNISLKPKGTAEFGNRAEIKNMSSFKFVCEALEYEIKRQSEILIAGGIVSQETRLFDESKKITVPMRSKEEAPDYRYFPDPDLIEIELESSFMENIQRKLPVFPDERMQNLIRKYNIPQADAYILTKDKFVSDYFDSCIPHCQNIKKLARWIINDLLKLVDRSTDSAPSFPISAKNFAELVNIVADGEITENIGKTVLNNMVESGKSALQIIDEQNLKQVQDTDLLNSLVDKAIEENPDLMDQIKQGKMNAVNFLVGQVMAKTQGKANAKKVKDIILSKSSA